MAERQLPTGQTVTGVEGMPLAELEKQAILISLERNDWKRMKTCRELGISKDTLRRKLHSYGFDDDGLKQNV